MSNKNIKELLNNIIDEKPSKIESKATEILSQKMIDKISEIKAEIVSNFNN